MIERPEDLTVLVVVVVLTLAFLTALGRGWLHTNQTTQHLIDQWRSRYEDMRDDRNYWRQESRQAQRDSERAKETGKKLSKEAGCDPSTY